MIHNRKLHSSVAIYATNVLGKKLTLRPRRKQSLVNLLRDIEVLVDASAMKLDLQNSILEADGVDVA
jgi:hypothetical protein